MKLKHDLKLIFFISAITFAGHPTYTDDAFSLGSGAFEIEILSEFYKHDYSKELTIPIGLSYGISENTDLALGLSYNSSWEGSLSLRSFDDISVELKHIFLNDFLKIGVKPFITLPTGNTDKGFGKGKVNYGAYLLVTKEWEGLHLHTQFGYTRNNNIVQEKTDLWDYSIAVEKFLTEKLSAVFEFGLAKNCCYEPVEHTRFILGGVIYQLNESLTLDIGLMRGLSEVDPNFGLMTGLTIGL